MKNTTPTEHREQADFFQKARDLYAEFPQLSVCLFAIPNGGDRHILTAMKMREEGVRKGTPDIFCAIPSGSWHGLFIEMKRLKGGSLSPEQKKALETIGGQGYKTVVAKGCEEAFRELVSYLKL